MPLVTLDRLTKRYPGGVTALDALSSPSSRASSAWWAPTGPASRRSSRSCSGLLDASGGSARVFDLDVATQGRPSASWSATCPSTTACPPDISASDFVNHMARMSGLPRASARERTADVLRHVGLFEERYRPMGGYSTGMKQRVKLAQALVHDPRLLLLDEPTNGLDPAGRDEMLDLIRAHRQRVRHRHHHGQPPARRDRARLRLPRGHRRRAAAAGGRAGHVHAADRHAPRRGGRRPAGPGRSDLEPTGWRCASMAATSSSRCATRPRSTPCATPSSTSTSACVRLEPRRGSLEDLFRDARRGREEAGRGGRGRCAGRRR